METTESKIDQKTIHVDIQGYVRLTITNFIEPYSMKKLEDMPIGSEKITNFITGQKEPIYFILQEPTATMDNVDDFWLHKNLSTAIEDALRKIAGENLKLDVGVSAERAADNVLRIMAGIAKGKFAPNKIKFHTTTKPVAPGDVVAEMDLAAISHRVNVIVYNGSPSDLPENGIDSAIDSLGKLFGSRIHKSLSEINRCTWTQPFHYGDKQLTAKILWPFEEAADWYTSDVLCGILASTLQTGAKKVAEAYGLIDN